MHKIAEKEFTIEDFSHEHLTTCSKDALLKTIEVLNFYRTMYFNCRDSDKKDIWWQMIQLLPSSYNQTRNVMLNYEVLANIYHSRKNHPLDEWCVHETPEEHIFRNKDFTSGMWGFCDWIETLPYSELITCDSKKADQKTGKWILMDDTYTRFKCSSCEINNVPMTYNYCPHCGCEMER